MNARPDLERVLGALKDFQRDTVDHVFARMHDPQRPSRRFLVADEVGLGKTLVARGIVARTVDALWDSVDRIDIVYICSNASIARQNINRLNITGREDHRLPDRITLLPRDIRLLKNNKINFVSFTPGTSFQLKSSQGMSAERELLYWLLPDDWKQAEAGAITLLTGYADRGRFKSRVDTFRGSYSIDQELLTAFHVALAEEAQAARGKPQSLATRFRDLSSSLGRRTRLTLEESEARTAIISELRGILAAVCVHSLEPDLIILDEFQRFSDLLHGDDDASQLARKLFTFPDARVLLLSATPYRMYAVEEEAARSDHYTDLMQTVRFLLDDDAGTERFRRALQEFREGLFDYRVKAGRRLQELRDGVARELRSVMVRTERLAVTADRSGMLAEVPAMHCSIEASDLESFLGLQSLARELGHDDMIELWKSAPYLLSFMDDYRLKTDFTLEVEQGLEPESIVNRPGLLLSADDVRDFRPLDPANARLRSLAADTVGAGLWRLTWLPPSLPYYRPEGEFESAVTPTKRLVFSAWQVVPKVVSSLLSYEAERRMIGVEAGQPDSFTPEVRRRRGRRLDFVRSAERLGGMPVVLLMYPSLALAQQMDPLRWRIESGGACPTLAETLERGRRACADLLRNLPSASDSGREDDRWYWAAPVLLDAALDPDAAARWSDQADLASLWRQPPEEASSVVSDEISDTDDEPADDRWSEHVDELRKLLHGELELGRQPADLPEVLALAAIAGPGVCALRALTRISGGGERASSPELRNRAGWIAEGVRSLFNQPDVSEMLRQNAGEQPYWRVVLDYCARGCLQSVLDEYAHVLVEDLGLQGRGWRHIAGSVASRMAAVLKLRTANVMADTVAVNGDRLRMSDGIRFRSRFAVRYGARGAEDAAGARRELALRHAFNSPFWPFVLCSTSVGQEGLDFHPYCHAVVHWNLPSNPVDLEQREGRVHRYKGHAVRKNVARAHSADLALEQVDAYVDPWTALFEAARTTAPRQSDLVPFWVYPLENGARIERHLPMIPFSRDAARADALRRALTLYRMAFGQSRQEDVVRYLLAQVPAEEVGKVAADLCIDLSPDPSPHRSCSGQITPPGEDEEHDDRASSGPSLGDFRRLLDEFARIRPGASVRTCADFERLLDEFSRVWIPVVE